MNKRYLDVPATAALYGPTESALRKWIRNGALGSAVVRAGRRVFLDTVILDKRLFETGKLLVDEGMKPNAVKSR